MKWIIYMLGLCIMISLASAFRLPNIHECDNLGLKESVYCLNDFVNSFYKFRINDDYNILSDQELKSQGGDCLDYSRFYVNHLTNLGFHAQYVNMYMSKEYSHTIALVSGNETYCILDQSFVWCMPYEI